MGGLQDCTTRAHTTAPGTNSGRADRSVSGCLSARPLKKEGGRTEGRNRRKEEGRKERRGLARTTLCQTSLGHVQRGGRVGGCRIENSAGGVCRRCAGTGREADKTHVRAAVLCDRGCPPSVLPLRLPQQQGRQLQPHRGKSNILSHFENPASFHLTF